jgi:dihydroxyacetone kinase
MRQAIAAQEKDEAEAVSERVLVTSEEQLYYKRLAAQAGHFTALLKVEGGANLADSLATAAEKIIQIGQAKPGDKTMLDALIPAAKAADGPDPLPAAIEAATKGLEATRAMAAKRGRARYVEGAGLGHLDAGALSVVECLTVLGDVTGGAA